MVREAPPSDDQNINAWRAYYRDVNRRHRRRAVAAVFNWNLKKHPDRKPTPASVMYYNLQRNAEGHWFIPAARLEEFSAMDREEEARCPAPKCPTARCPPFGHKWRKPAAAAPAA